MMAIGIRVPGLAGPLLLAVIILSAGVRGDEPAADAARRKAAANELQKKRQIIERAAQFERREGVVDERDGDIEVLIERELPSKVVKDRARDDGFGVLPSPSEPKFRLADATCDHMLFGKAGNAAAARSQLADRLRQKIKFVDRTCELTDAQKQKLELAGRGDISRLFGRADEIRVRIQLIDDERALGNNRAFMEWIQDMAAMTQPLRHSFDSGPFDENSLFAKTMKRALTADQAARYAERNRVFTPELRSLALPMK